MESNAGRRGRERSGGDMNYDVAATRATRGYRGRALSWHEIAAPTRPRHVERPERGPVARERWVPPADHPWREALRRAVERRAARALPGAARPSLASLSASP